MPRTLDPELQSPKACVPLQAQRPSTKQVLICHFSGACNAQVLQALMEEEIRGEQARAREQSALLELSQIKVRLFDHVARCKCFVIW